MRKKIIRGLWVAGGICLLLAITLAAHIYVVTRPADVHHNNWQLARIDIQQPAEPASLDQAVAMVKSEPGVKHAFLNEQDGIIVYGYEPGTLEPDAVLAQVNALPVKARAFTVSAEAAANGCPVIDKSSVTYRFSTFLKNLFHR
jgi:hypothetical protein